MRSNILVVGCLVLFCCVWSKANAEQTEKEKIKQAAVAVQEDCQSQAIISLLEGKWEDLASYAKRWSAESPNDPVPHYLMGLASYSIEQYGQVDRQYKLAFGNEEDTNKVLVWSKQLVANHPNNPFSYFLLGGAYAAKGMVDEEISCYERVVALDSKFAKGWACLGVAFSRIGLEDKGIECFSKAIEVNAKDAEAFFKLGALYGRKQMNEKSLSSYEQAIRLNPQLDGAKFGMGLTYYQMECYDKAAQLFKEAIVLNPEDVDSYYFLGHCYVQSQSNENPDEAIKCFQKAIELNPKHDQAYLNLGALYYYKGMNEKALWALQQACAYYDEKKSSGQDPRPALKKLREIIEIKNEK